MLTEYETSTEEYWSVEDFESGLGPAFQITPADLPAWHAALAGQGRAWEIIRRLYRVAPLIGISDDDTRPWSQAELAAHYGIEPSIVEAEVKNAISHWQNTLADQSVSRELYAGGITIDELERLTRFSHGDGLDRDMIQRLLDAFGFAPIQGDALRAEVAARIISLREYLGSPHTRVMARQVIRLEVSLNAQEKLLSSWQNRLDDTLADDPSLEKNRAEVELIRAKLTEIEKETRTISTSHAKLQKELGADEIDLTARKRLFVETVAYIMEQCRIYESDPENWKTDGVFTAAEIDWLLEHSGERTPQYRPDIVTRVNEALLPQNLWNPKFQPSPINRKVTGDLLKIVESLRSTYAHEDPPEDQDGVPAILDADDEEEAHAIGMSDAGAALAADAMLESPNNNTPNNTAEAPTHANSLANLRRTKQEESCIGVF